jgi:excisionase family DNA binding protein
MRRRNKEDQSARFEIAMPDQVQTAPRPSAPINREEVDPSHAELPMTVKEAARFLGVSTQTVYLGCERKRIPHLRVMGRTIRFLKSDLLPFRATFRQEVENAKTE